MMTIDCVYGIKFVLKFQEGLGLMMNFLIYTGPQQWNFLSGVDSNSASSEYKPEAMPPIRKCWVPNWLQNNKMTKVMANIRILRPNIF
jgi:hypothetical protein